MVGVEVVRFLPHVAAEAVDADGDVALEDDSPLPCIVVYCPHLCVQHELHVVIERHVFPFLSVGEGVLLAFTLVPRLVVGPAGEVGSVISVAQRAIDCVRDEPLLLLVEELAESVCLHRSLTFVHVADVKVFRLGFVHPFVIYLRQCVELLLQGGKPFACAVVGEWGQLPEVGILRMESKHADA